MPEKTIRIKKTYFITFLILFILLSSFILYSFYFFKKQLTLAVQLVEEQNRSRQNYHQHLSRLQGERDSLEKMIHLLLQENDRLLLVNESLNTTDYYLVLDVSEHLFYLMRNDIIIYSDIFGSGKGSILVDNKYYSFDTPRKEFQVTAKQTNPWWIRPSWYWKEKNLPIPKNFITIPEYLPYYKAIQYYHSLSSEEKNRVRKVPGALGKYKITLKDGYLIHYGRGLGRNSSHGCIRVSAKSIDILFRYLKVGSPVFIY